MKRLAVRPICSTLSNSAITAPFKGKLMDKMRERETERDERMNDAVSPVCRSRAFAHTNTRHSPQKAHHSCTNVARYNLRAQLRAQGKVASARNFEGQEAAGHGRHR